MIRRPPRSTRTDTLFPYTTLFRSNIITKRQFKGLTGRVEGGISERGDASQYRLSLTGGVGDIDEQGYNAYLSGLYYRSEQLFNRQRPYPYNSDDLLTVCNDGHCGPNPVIATSEGAGQ